VTIRCPLSAFLCVITPTWTNRSALAQANAASYAKHATRPTCAAWHLTAAASTWGVCSEIGDRVLWRYAGEGAANSLLFTGRE